ncbi:transposase [Paraburkholderia fungorum]|uniref:transposase n=1 Tax=Paraburkholderia fungorum TaxID=134537 RepID=UPI0038BA0D21
MSWPFGVESYGSCRKAWEAVTRARRTGATWSAMPRKYPSYQTCHRRFKAWYESGVLKRVMDQLFGAASEELCNLMEARMRKHVSAEQKSVDTAKVAPTAPAVYGPAAVKPLPSSPFAYASPFKHAA